MLLNLLRTEDVDPSYMIRRSFHQFQSQKAYPQMKEKLKELQEKKKILSEQFPEAQTISKYVKIRSQIETVSITHTHT